MIKIINYKYIVKTNDNKETLVLLCGLGANVNMFHLQEELSSYYNLLIVDFVKDVDVGKISIEYMADCVIQLMERLNIEQAHILGVSLGGSVAQEIYKQQPDRLKSLILANSVSYVNDNLLKWGIEQRKRKLERTTDEEYIDETVSNCLLFKCDDTEQIAKDAFTINRNTYIKTASVLLGHDYTNTLRQIDIPVLILSGIFDVTTIMTNQMCQYWLIRRSRIKYYVSGHLPNIECSKEFNRDVLKFLNEVE